MIQGKVKLVVDLGNSSTKCAILYKKSTEDKEKVIEFESMNEFGMMLDEDAVVKYINEYDDRTSTVLKNGGATYCNGELQRINYASSAIRPSASFKKYLHEGTPLVFKLAFLKATRIIMNLEGVTSPTQLDLEWTVVTLLPPGDIDAGREKLTEVIKSIDEVWAVHPDMYIVLKDKDDEGKQVVFDRIGNVVVLPEGLCAYMAIVFDTGRVVRPKYKYLTQETVLVLDIGAGTTDFVLIKSNKLVQGSKNSINIGCNNVTSKVKMEVNKEGFTVNRNSLADTISKGYIRQGAKTIDISDTIQSVKTRLGMELKNNIIEYFESGQIDPSEIGYIIICGGGSVDDESGIKSLGNYVVEAFKQVIPNTELIEAPIHKVCRCDEQYNIKEVEEVISPRELNLVGACIMAETV